MTENEPMMVNRQPSFVWVCAITLGTAMLCGGVAGYFDELRETNQSTESGLWLQLLVLLGGLAVLGFYLSRFGKFWQNWSRRKQLYWASLILAAALGLFSSMALQLETVAGSDQGLFESGAIGPGVAIALSAIWIGGMGLSILLYHRSVDDHEKQAYLWGGLAGFYAIVFPAPTWWLLARAELTPPVHGMALFLLALIANAVVYFWLKYR